MEYAHDLTYHVITDHESWGYKVVIRGALSEKAAVEYFLKW